MFGLPSQALPFLTSADTHSTFTFRPAVQLDIVAQYLKLTLNLKTNELSDGCDPR